MTNGIQRQKDFDAIIEEGRKKGWTGKQCFEKYKVLHPNYCIEDSSITGSECLTKELAYNKDTIRKYRSEILSSEDITQIDKDTKNLVLEELEHYYFKSK